MNVYEVITVLDNPLFSGIPISDMSKFDSCPTDWKKNMDNWEAAKFGNCWRIPRLDMAIKKYHDYPCINNSYPAFSQRAVDVLGDFLVENGELLPVILNNGTCYYFNCTKLVNVVDIQNSKMIKYSNFSLPDINDMAFHDNLLNELVIFKDRRKPYNLFCTEVFKNRFESAGLQGMVFSQIWQLPTGIRYGDVCYEAQRAAEKWKPKGGPELDIKGNALVIRLYCERKKPTKAELNQAEVIMQLLEKQLEFSDERPMDTYYGNVEGHDPVDFEIRIFMSAPDVDRLVDRLITTLKQLPWNGKYQVAKRRAEYFDTKAKEEYVRFTD